MAKLSDYELKKLGQQAVDFFEDTRDIINLGKVAHVIVNAVPAWSADNGEMAFYDNEATTPSKRIYVRLASSWELFATPGTAEAAGRDGSVQINSSDTLWASSGIFYDLATSGMYVSSGATLFLQATSMTSVGTPGNNMVVMANVRGPGNEDGLLIRSGVGDVNALGHYFGEDFLAINNGTSGAANSVGGSEGYILLINKWSGSNNDHTGINAGSVKFGDSSNTLMTITIRKAAAGPSGDAIFRSGPCLVLRPRLQLGSVYKSGGFLHVSDHDDIDGDDVSWEWPSAVFGGNDTAVAGITRGILNLVPISGTAIAISNQRTWCFLAPQIGKGGQSSVVSVSNAATVYIDGAPVAESGVNLINNYALWVAGGNVRIGGDVIIGGKTLVAASSTAIGTIFTTTALGVSSNNTADTTLLRGIVGTTSLVANTLSDGRTIRLQARGYYNTASSAPSLQWRVKLGGTTVLTTGSLQTVASVSTGMFDLTGLITCWTTGGAGTVYAQGGVQMGTSGLNGHHWAMVNSGTITLNTTGANVVEITAQWGSGAFQNEVAMTHAVVELLN